MNENPEFGDILKNYEYGISYTPTAIEPSPFEWLAFLEPKIIYTIQPIRTLDPAEEVQKAASSVEEGPAFILMPGREFDATGTRHGTGAGWYDRFLAATPRDWLRIGMCYREQFSNTPLERKAWDEPMDFVCVVDRAVSAMACIETHARES